MARESQSERLDRIEEKIDKMSEAIIALARAEEKIITLTSFSKQQSEQIQSVINRVDKIDEIVRTNSNTVNFINKIFWIVMAAAATVITGMLILGPQYNILQ